MGLFETIFGKKKNKKDITAEGIYKALCEDIPFERMEYRQSVLSDLPIDSYFTDNYNKYYPKSDLKYMHSISTDETFVDMLEDLQNYKNTKDFYEGKTIIIGLPTDYQIGKTLEYIFNNKSITESGRFLDNITNMRIFNTPIDVQIAFRIDKELTR